MKKLILLLIVLSLFSTAQSQSWNITGNGGTNPGINFLGTTDNNPLKFRVNNVYAGEIDSVTGKTFFGYGAGSRVTSGINNVAVGYKALFSNTTGNYNTATGYSALTKNTTGSSNTATGNYALFQNTTGILNTAMGSAALFSNTTGSQNSASGFYALFSNTTGNYNTATGNYSLASSTTGYSNTATGSYALFSNTIGWNNTATGDSALFRNIDGFGNTAIGRSALRSNTTGFNNTATGSAALYSNTTGIDNIAIGTGALYSNTAGGANTAVGNFALSYNSTGTFNIAIGEDAMLRNTTGGDNTAVGFGALASSKTGTGNTAIGAGAAYYNSKGSRNTAIGHSALNTTTNSQHNTVIGYRTGYNYNLGWNNTLLGANSDVNATGLFNCVAVGESVICTASSQARIGNSSTNSIGGYANWTNISDGRYKKDINQNVRGLEFIMKLQPITYHLNISGISKKLSENKNNETDEFTQKAIAEKEKILFSGFVAQDVEKAAKETGYDFSGVDKPKNENDFYGLRYAEFVVPLVKAVQEQQQIINELIKQNANLQQRINNLEKNPVSNNASSNNTKELISAWPNPSNDIVLINLVTESESKATIKVYDNRGALVKEHRASVLKGSNQVTIDMRTLPAATYHFSAEWDNGKMKRTVQVIKQ